MPQKHENEVELVLAADNDGHPTGPFAAMFWVGLFWLAIAATVVSVWYAMR